MKTVIFACVHNAGRSQIAAANLALQSYVAGERESIERRLAAASERVRANRVLNSREYASCLFPRKLLEQFLLDFPV